MRAIVRCRPSPTSGPSKRSLVAAACASIIADSRSSSAARSTGVSSPSPRVIAATSCSTVVLLAMTRSKVGFHARMSVWRSPTSTFRSNFNVSTSGGNSSDLSASAANRVARVRTSCGPRSVPLINSACVPSNSSSRNLAPSVAARSRFGSIAPNRSPAAAMVSIRSPLRRPIRTPIEPPDGGDVSIAMTRGASSSKRRSREPGSGMSSTPLVPAMPTLRRTMALRPSSILLGSSKSMPTSGRPRTSNSPASTFTESMRPCG